MNIRRRNISHVGALQRRFTVWRYFRARVMCQETFGWFSVRSPRYASWVRRIPAAGRDPVFSANDRVTWHLLELLDASHPFA